MRGRRNAIEVELTEQIGVLVHGALTLEQLDENSRLVVCVGDLQPLTLSNVDLVTQSLTLMAGNKNSPLSAISFNLWTPVVVSSLIASQPMPFWTTSWNPIQENY